VKKASAESEVEDADLDEEKPETVEDVADDGMWSAKKLENDLDGLVGADYVSLLLEHEEHIRTPHDENSICELVFLF
jgi:protein kinase C substrate 80K-H